jgi:hypothetical protein
MQQSLRDELDEEDRILDETERIAGTLPQRERWLRLNHSFSRRLIAAQREWLDDVERELDS